MNVESISSLTALLYEVRQLSRRPAQVNQCASLKHFKKIRPGRYNQDKSMAGRYGAGVDIRGIIVPLPHSATTLGGDHTFRRIEKKHYQRDQRKNRLL
jgi:hypothetical protein